MCLANAITGFQVHIINKAVTHHEVVQATRFAADQVTRDESSAKARPHGHISRTA